MSDDGGQVEKTVTLHLPIADCTVTDTEVLYGLPVERWKRWLPAFEAMLGGMETTSLDVRGSG